MPVVVDMLLHTLYNAYICALLVHAVLASSHDQGSTLGAVAALRSHYQGLQLPSTAVADQIDCMPVVVNMLLHALYNAYICALLVHAVLAS
jgi:hypothetical protein